MKRLCLLVITLIPVLSFAQGNLKNISKKSWQTFVYRVTTDEASRFIKWDSIPVNQFVELTPSYIFKADSLDEDKLPVGNYIFISTRENNVNAQLMCISNLIALTINNKQQLQIDVRTKQGIFLNGVKVFVNNKEAIFNDLSKTWWVKNKRNDEAIVKVYAPGDTLFTQLEAKDDLTQTIPEQRKYNYRHSGLYKVLSWIPGKISSLFNPTKSSSNRIGATGYIIFNQPKYKPLDTVKFKGYVIDKKWKQYNKPIDIYLNYNSKGNYKEQLITTVQPTTNGSYIDEFILADTIPTDISCNLIFKTPGKKEIIRERFKIEDYVLDEIATYTFKSEKEIYFKNDSLRFFTSAKDANGLPIMDADAILILTTKTIHQFYQDTIYIIDTIYQKKMKMLAEGDTRFVISPNSLPRADITINARLLFKNSNNELHEENEIVEYKYFSREIIVSQEADSIKAVYVENGIVKDKEGEMEMNDDTAIAIHFPCTFKIDPVAEEYSFYTKEENKKNILFEYINVKENYRLYLKRISSKDTLGFVLSNPYKIPVYFTVFDGKKIIASGKQSAEQVTWKKLIANHRQSYKVRWQYIWAGIENYGEENIGLLYKLLNIDISANSTIFPGQKDSVAIDVKDYNGFPAAGVNITAVSYNNQFQKDIHVPEPPYLAKYKNRQYIEHEGFENDGPILLTKNYLLGKNKSWINKFHLDTMIYYKLLFPATGSFDAVTLLEKFIPELSVTIVDNGVPQEIYLLYINRELIYYNGVTDRMSYSFPVFPDNVQLGIRLKDRYIEIDSFYVQPNYKHDISFDINNLPRHSTVKPVTSFWSYAEMSLLEQSIWQMENSNLNNNAFIWQDNRVLKLSGNREHLAGPFRQSTMQFFNPGNFDIAFTFEPGYRYNLSKQIVRLEKRSIFPVKNNKNFLPITSTTKMILGDTLLTAPGILYTPNHNAPFLITTKDGEHNQYADNMLGMGALQLNINKDSVIKYVILLETDSLIKPIVFNYLKTISSIRPGVYTILFITSNFNTATLKNILIRANGTSCINIDSVQFEGNNSVLNLLLDEAAKTLIEKKKKVLVIEEPKNEYKISDDETYAIAGGGTVSGKVVDNKGKNPVPFAIVKLKGYKRVVASDAAGNFVFNNLKPGKYILVISSVGYVSMEAPINCVPNDNVKVDFILKVSSQSLSEVVVTGYGSVKRKELTGSISFIKGQELSFNMLQGRVAGVTIISQGAPGSSPVIQIRGISSFSGNNKPLYVIDGIIYEEIPKNFNSENASEVIVLKDEAATALYGLRAANGVVVITTKTKTLRKDFRDYAFWEPDLVTDKNGHASFDVYYPDNYYWLENLCSGNG